MTKLEMQAEFRRKFREYSKKKREEVDREISNALSKWTVTVGGSLFILGLIGGRLAR